MRKLFKIQTNKVADILKAKGHSLLDGLSEDKINEVGVNWLNNYLYQEEPVMLIHKGTKSIQTKRLCLRKYSINDTADIFENYATDNRVTKFLSWQPYDNIEDLQLYISEQVSNYADNIYNWVIEYQNQVIGSISAMTIDEKNESCEIGYCLGFEFWNKGIMTEAMSAVIQYLFLEVGFHRIAAKHDVENPASGKVMMNGNMTYEGRLREYYLRHDGIYSDSLIYSILKNELTSAV